MMGVHGIVGFLVVIFCSALLCNGQKEKCPETGLAAIVAQQNGVMVDLSKEQQSILSQLAFLESDMQSQLPALKDEVKNSKKDLLAVQSHLKNVKAELKSTQKDVGNLKDKVEVIEKKLSNVEIAVKKKTGGSIYVRWGRKLCPDGDKSALVYSGMVGGKHYTQKGSGTNPLCLTMDPKYDSRTKPTSIGYIYGSEYEGISELQDKEIPCSVCRTPFPSTIMVPGTYDCPKGWTYQYSGHVVSAFNAHFATQYVCLDGQPETMSNVATNSNGKLFYMVVSQCGSLPCPPYENNKVVTCVVCSK